MARVVSRPQASSHRTLGLLISHCCVCGQKLRVDYDNFRRLETLQGSVRLRLRIGRCHREGCARFHRPTRPEEESAIALPQHEFALDVIAWVGQLRYQEHRSVPEMEMKQAA